MKTTTARFAASALALASLTAGTASADNFTFRIGSGHPNGPAVYVADVANFFVPEVKKRAAEAGLPPTSPEDLRRADPESTSSASLASAPPR